MLSQYNQTMKAKMNLSVFRNPYTFAVLAITLLGAFFRLYHFEGFVGFLGDQGRDAIVMKRIATFEHFPGIGASSSVGNVFLGPFFYYYGAVWLKLFGLQPIGPAYGVVFAWILSLPLMYVMLRRFFSERVAMVTTFCMALSYSMIWLSRFAWNPNLMPITSLFCVLAFWEARRSRHMVWYALVGALLSVSMQMHYVALALCLPLGITMIRDGVRAVQAKKLVVEIRYLGMFLAGWVVLTLPLILFDIQNRFMNLRGIWEMLVGGGNRSSGRPALEEIGYTFTQLFYHAFRFDVSQLTALVLLAGIAGYGLYMYRTKRMFESMTSFFFLTTLVLTSFFTQVKNLHYLGVLYPFLYLIVAQWLGFIRARKGIVVSVVCMIVFALLQREVLSYVRNDGSFLIRRAERISAKIFEESDSKVVQITSLPDHYGDYMYRYFMEVWGNRPVERASLIKAEELFVVCEEACTPIGDPQWDIAYFQPTDIVGQWDVEDVTIYKLIRK